MHAQAAPPEARSADGGLHEGGTDVHHHGADGQWSTARVLAQRPRVDADDEEPARYDGSGIVALAGKVI